MLHQQINRLKKASRLDALILATTTDKNDDAVAEIAESAFAHPVHRISDDHVPIDIDGVDRIASPSRFPTPPST